MISRKADLQQTGARIPRPLYTQVKALAARRGVSLSQIVTEALEAYLAK